MVLVTRVLRPCLQTLGKRSGGMLSTLMTAGGTGLQAFMGVGICTTFVD